MEIFSKVKNAKGANVNIAMLIFDPQNNYDGNSQYT